MMWFSSRAPREQALILLALGLTLVFGLWQFMIKPVYSAHETATRQHMIAERDLDIVQQKAAVIGSAAAASASDRSAFDRSALITAARDANIPISRVQPQENNALQVWFDNGNYKDIFTLLQILDSRYAVEVSRLQITRRAEGGVRANMTLTPIGGATQSPPP